MTFIVQVILADGEVPERIICLAIASDEIVLGIQSTIFIIRIANSFNLNLSSMLSIILNGKW